MTPESAIPRVVWVEVVAGIQKDRPLIAWHNHLATSKFGFGAKRRLKSINNVK
jgi:hypothetical protein